MKNRWLRSLLLVLVVVAAGVLIFGRGDRGVPPDNKTGEDDPNGEVEFVDGFYRPQEEDLPEEIVQWIGFSREVPLVQEKVYQGDRFVLITEGEMPAGSKVEVAEVVTGDDSLEVRVRSVEGEALGATAYPYDIIVVERDDLPLRFVDVDNPDRYFMGLLGIDQLDRPIVAASEWIKVFSPKPGEEVEGTIDLVGLANVFEGTVIYELVSEDGEVLAHGFTTGAMGDWGHFEEEILIPQELGETQAVLELYSESAKDGSKMFVVTIPLEVKG